MGRGAHSVSRDRYEIREEVKQNADVHAANKHEFNLSGVAHEYPRAYRCSIDRRLSDNCARRLKRDKAKNGPVGRRLILPNSTGGADRDITEIQTTGRSVPAYHQRYLCPAFWRSYSDAGAG